MTCLRIVWWSQACQVNYFDNNYRQREFGRVIQDLDKPNIYSTYSLVVVLNREKSHLDILCDRHKTLHGILLEGSSIIVQATCQEWMRAQSHTNKMPVMFLRRSHGHHEQPIREDFHSWRPHRWHLQWLTTYQQCKRLSISLSLIQWSSETDWKMQEWLMAAFPASFQEMIAGWEQVGSQEATTTSKLVTIARRCLCTRHEQHTFSPFIIKHLSIYLSISAKYIHPQ